MPSSKRVRSSPNESSILLAISALRSKTCNSITAAAKAYDVPKSTLYDRIKGTPSREDYKPRNSPIEEEVLIKDILKLDSQGLSPTPGLVETMANSICQAKGILPIGRNRQ